MAITNAELRKLVNYGVAKDITKTKPTKTMQKNLSIILRVTGAAGTNGALLASNTGRLYVIIGRHENLFAYR